MDTLIAHIPVPHNLHFEWFRKHRGSELFLISENVAGKLLPARRHSAKDISTSMTVQMIASLNHLFCFGLKRILVINESFDISSLAFVKKVFSPSDPMSLAFACKYLDGKEVYMEDIWNLSGSALLTAGRQFVGVQ